LALKLFGAFGVGIEIGIGVGPSARSGPTRTATRTAFYYFSSPTYLTDPLYALVRRSDPLYTVMRARIRF